MSTTKEIKSLLHELRLQLDDEAREPIEPVLRAILDAAKPRTITEVIYRSDPQDQAEIDKLRATIAAQAETIGKLRSKLSTPPPLLDHMSFDDMLKEIDNKARAWCECATKCMQISAVKDDYRRRRKGFLHRWLRLSMVGVGNYLRHLEGCGRVDERKLKSILHKSFLNSLRQMASEIHSASEITVDLDLPPLNERGDTAGVARVNSNVVLVGVKGNSPAPQPPRANAADPAKKAARRRRRGARR